MRLIHIPTMVIREYQGEEVPPYAILSHTWNEEEVSFGDFQGGKGPSLKGYKKIRGCCEQAASDGLDAVWIDTCCIDKRSSAELSEAINSMFKWYQNAAICYAYLEDVDSDDEGASVATFPINFPKSRWFTRGWTLQELLAPSVVVFYSVRWVRIGTRRDLAEIIAETTQINIKFFETGNFVDFSIAQRMSWASQRQTTRIEDQAYCLLGLFGVNMPLLYGEGEQAFVRLQQEIMKESDDQTIFAWSSGPNPSPHLSGGLLASSPKLFADSGHIVKSQTHEAYGPYATTNKGLQISLPLIRADTTSSMLVPSRRGNSGTIPSIILTTVSHGNIAVLNCQPSDSDDLRVGLYIEKHQASGSYIRVNYQLGIALIPLQDALEKATPTDLLVQIQNKTEQAPDTSIYQTDRPILVQPFCLLASEFKLNRTESEIEWKQQPTGSLSSVILNFSSAIDSQKPCVLEYTSPEGHSFVLVLQKHVALTKVTGLEAFVLENAELAKAETEVRAQVNDAIHNLRRHGASIHQRSSNGLLSIVPKIIEARHASIVNLEARRVTSSNLGRKAPSSLTPTLH
ncbi:heterokaryon incompatibility protein-domain-containing protein [Xylaria cf. heliscus]|nr:heterokaryon incompatibility protein-domain-containing protein [Xylaria cf. heliscus]